MEREQLEALFAPFGQVNVRRMFGGMGVFHDGLMIAIGGDTLYLKADEDGAAEFDALNLPPFSFTRGDKTFAMSYRLAPPDFMGDEAVRVHWCRLAFEAALRAQARKPKRRKRAKPAPRGQ